MQSNELLCMNYEEYNVAPILFISYLTAAMT